MFRFIERFIKSIKSFTLIGQNKFGLFCKIFLIATKLLQEFKELKGVSNPRRVLDLQKEIEHLHWQLNNMENSR